MLYPKKLRSFDLCLLASIFFFGDKLLWISIKGASYLLERPAYVFLIASVQSSIPMVLLLSSSLHTYKGV